MTRTRLITAASLLGSVALGLAEPAFAASGGAINVIYRASGARDSGGGDNTGLQTVVHCTNLSNVNEDLVVVIRDIAGTIVGQTTQTKAPLASHIVVTKAGFLFTGTNLNTGAFAGGLVSIGSTTTQMACTVAIADAGAAGANSPQAMLLHMIRYNPAAGTQE